MQFGNQSLPAQKERVWEGLRTRLLPREGERFREFIRSQSYSGLKTVAAVEIAAPVLMLAGQMATEWQLRIWQASAMAVVGGLTLALSLLGWAKRRARLLAGISAWASGALLLWAALGTGLSFGMDDYILAGIILVVLTAAATVPFRPLEMLAVGFSVELVYSISASLAGRGAAGITAPHGAVHQVFLLLLVILAAGITAINYEHRRAEFNAHQEALRVAEILASAQLRAQLAENAISIGRLAAAVSHEINTPLGTLRSAIQTLSALAEREADAPPARREILDRMRAELSQSVHNSAARIEEVMTRLRRFVSLEEAELKSADINDLLSDVALLYGEQIEKGGIQLEFDLERPLPKLACRPQLLTVVFSSLLSNAVNAVNGNGRVQISTRRKDTGVEVIIQDNGRGMTPDEAASIFDPAFKVSEGRVASGNWSLFNTRQIVYEHGGQIWLDTAAGKGTAVHVNLPLP